MAAADQPAKVQSPSDRQTAVWPWLLVPLVTLAMFFALRSARDVVPPERPVDTQPVETVPAD
jgi:hypothetical protein